MNEVKSNFIGPVNVTNAILPHMRLRREGTIVLVGSRSAYRPMIVSTFLNIAPRFVSQSSDYIGPGYAPRLDPNMTTRADPYPYAQSPTQLQKQRSTVRNKLSPALTKHH